MPWQDLLFRIGILIAADAVLCPELAIVVLVDRLGRGEQGDDVVRFK